MKKIFFSLCFSLIIIGLQAQNDTIFNAYLLDLMHRQYDLRRENLREALPDANKLKAYQLSAKESYKALLGDLPNILTSATPVAETVGVIEQNGYRIEKLIFNRRITANLYLPDGEGQKPAVIFFCGHEPNGKSGESYQRTAALFARNGFVVLIADPIGQGERLQLLDKQGKAKTPRATSEHTLLNMGTSLVGWSVMQEELADNFACMNYLISRPEVDSARIGCLGNSGGGTQNTFFAALDDRIKATACCSYFTKHERMWQLFGADDGCQTLWGEANVRLEIADYYLMQAPRPTLILVGTQDFMNYEGALEAFDELKTAYNTLQSPGNAEFFAVEDGHGISQPKRERAVQFFLKHLANSDTIVHENAITVLPDSVLRCTRNGQIAIDFPQEPTFQMRILKIIEIFAEERVNFAKVDLLSQQKFIREFLLNIPDILPKIHYKKIDEKIDGGYKFEKYIISRENEIDLPITVQTPLKMRKKYTEIHVVLGENVKKITTDSENIVVYADLRGTGELKDNRQKNNAKFYSDDYRTAALSLILGRPLIGQQVVDLFSVMDFIKQENSLYGEKITWQAEGNIGVALQHAAFLDNRISNLKLINCPKTWTDIARNPLLKNRMGIVLPHVLQFYDLDFFKK